MNSPNWLSVAIDNLVHRNKVQTAPFEGVYRSCQNLWTDYRLLLQQHVDLTNQILSLQHEVNEETSRIEKSSSIDKLKLKLISMQDAMKIKNVSVADEVRERLSLHRRVEEQSKSLFDVQDKLRCKTLELDAANESLQNYKKSVDELNQIIDILKKELVTVRSGVASTELRSRQLEQENKELVDRIMSEKLKNANEMNEMTKALDKQRKSVGNGIGFLKAIGGAVGGAVGGVVSQAVQGASSIPTSSSVTRGRSASMKSERSETGDNDRKYSVDDGGSSMKFRSEIRPSDIDDLQDSYVTDDFQEVQSRSNSLSVVEGSAVPKTPRKVMRCHDTEINDIIASGNFFITAGADSVVKIFDFQTQQLLHKLQTGGPVFSVDRVGDWALGASSDRSCRVWNITSGRQLFNLSSHQNKVYAAKFIGSEGDTGSRQVVTGSSDRSVRLFDTPITGASRLLGTMTTNSSVNSVAVSPDSNTLSSGHQDGGIRFWDRATCQRTHYIARVHTSNISSLEYGSSYGPSFNMLLSGSRDNSLCLVDVRSCETVRVFRSPSFRMSCDWSKVSFSPDGHMVAAGSYDGTVLVWDVGSGGVVEDLGGQHACPVDSVHWGRYGVVSCDQRGKVIFWH